MTIWIVLPLKNSWLDTFTTAATAATTAMHGIKSLKRMTSPCNGIPLLVFRQRGPSFQKPAVTRDMIFSSQLREHEPKHRGIARYNRNSELLFHFLQAIHWIEHGALKINRVDALMLAQSSPGIGHDVLGGHLERVGVMPQRFAS